MEVNRCGQRIVLLAGLTLAMAACTQQRSVEVVGQPLPPGGAVTTPPAARIATPSLPPRDDQLRAVDVNASLVKPARRGSTDDMLLYIRVPAGFSINVFARGLEGPRMMAVNANGDVYVSEPGMGSVTLLRDTNGDGVADVNRRVVTGLSAGRGGVHGVAIRDGKLYMVTETALYVGDIAADGSVSTPVQVIGDLPNGGQHPNRVIRFGPDGTLYMSVGSTCNACVEPNAENATILAIDTNTWSRRIHARGLRNTIGFDWHPITGVLWGMDHNSDWHGPDFPPEELNRIERDADYGWPFCAGRQLIDPYVSAEPPQGMARDTYCRNTAPSVMEIQAHSAPMSMVFYNGSQFPAEYAGDAFVALHGSWNRNPPTGYEVVRIRFDSAGDPVGVETFASGWLIENGTAQFGRVTGLAQARDGSLLVGDDSNGIIYRIAYTAGD